MDGRTKAVRFSADTKHSQESAAAIAASPYPTGALESACIYMGADDDEPVPYDDDLGFISINESPQPSSTSEQASTPEMSADDLVGSMLMPDDDGISFIDLAKAGAPTPIKYRLYSAYQTVEALTGKNRGYHDIAIMTRMTNPTSRFFVKKTTENSAIAEIECACAGFYDDLVHGMVSTSTRPVYEATSLGPKIVGVSSKALPNFVSTKEKDGALQLQDLSCSLMDKGLSIQQIEEINERLEDDELNKDDEDVLAQAEIVYTAGQAPVAIDVTCGDMKSYRILKGLGLGLTASYLFKEDDLHRGNMDKKGRRCDFDGSEWDSICYFKVTTYLDKAYRLSNIDTRFPFTENDIRKFPNIVDATPYYFPTRRDRNIGSRVGAILSNNPWNPEEQRVFSMLESNPIFNFYKFKTLLKYILSTSDDYKNIALLHIRADLRPSHVTKLNYPGDDKTFIQMFTDNASERIKNIRKILVTMPEFAEFMNVHGAEAYRQIRNEKLARNNHYEQKIAKAEDTEIGRHKRYSYGNLLTNMDALDQRFQHVLSDVDKRVALVQEFEKLQETLSPSASQGLRR